MTRIKPVYCPKNPYTVYSLWGEIVGGTLQNNFNLSVVVDNQSYNVITDAWFEDIITQKYYDRLYYTPSESAELAAAAFAVDFVNWKNQTSANWQRIVRAMVAEYNPVENYASHEVVETEHGHVVELEHGHVEELEHGHVSELEHGHVAELEHGHVEELEHGLQTDIEYGKVETDVNTPDDAKVTTNRSEYGYNSASAVPTGIEETTKSGTDTNELTYSGTDTTTNSGKDTTTNSGKDTTTNSGKDTTTNSGKDTTTNSGKDTITTDKSGNIGVMTAQAMITEELKLRLYNVTERAILAFMNAYTIY